MLRIPTIESSIEVTGVPEGILKAADREFRMVTDYVGYLAYKGYPGAAREWWSSLTEEAQTAAMTRHVLRQAMGATETEISYAAAAFAVNGIDLSL